MKIKFSVTILTLVILGALTGYLYYKNFSIKVTETPHYTDASATTVHITEDDAITALNLDNIGATANVSGLNVRIYLKDKHQWFIVDGDGKKFINALRDPNCGFKCINIPVAIP